jgi:hypothetical protein
MTVNLDELLSQSSSLKHHAMLLLSRRFGEEGLSEKAFRGIAQMYCGIVFPESESSESFWEAVARHPDVVVVDRERNQLRLEDVEGIRKLVCYPPNLSKRRLFFIDKAERLLPGAANSLLKTLEEPSIQALFLFTARSASGVLPTIASRCQKIPFAESIQPSRSPSELFEPEDWQLLRSRFLKIASVNPVLAQSLWDKPPTLVPPRVLVECLDSAQAIAKKYPAVQLQDGLVSLIAEYFESNPVVARYLVADISEWKNAAPMHPSPELWLSRIFLKLGGIS